ncbi:MAG: HD domain-containing protein [Actinobacteria bacterium]|nr:HD domain-containing protein [Actinomycetota bacterium]
MATLALAQDNAFAQPLESQLRSCVLAMWIGDEAGFATEVRDSLYWTSLLRYVGCTGHAHEVAAMFGDEISLRSRTLIQDAADLDEVISDAIAFATAGQGPREREHTIELITTHGLEWSVHNSQSGCEVGDMLLERLDFGPLVREALRFTFERWNGNGFPTHARGEDIPIAMRVVHLSHDMEAIARHASPSDALDAARTRRGRTYDPEIADLFLTHGGAWLDRLDEVEPWDTVLDLEPEPRRVLTGDALDDALTVAADFIDLKSPYMAGHSRRCALLVHDASLHLGLPADEVDTVRRAALVHDFGITAVPNSIWDRPSSLTRAERDRVERHTVITEQMLRRSPALATLNPVAAAHHEKPDGTGYHKGLPRGRIDERACVLAAADVYVALTSDRADRPAHPPVTAAALIRRSADDGGLDRHAVEAVLTAAGHASVRRDPADRPGGLTRREIQVLRLAARGLTTSEIAAQLYISAKTADVHIQHIYSKIGVSTRAAAALWAMQNGLVS